MYLVQMPQQHHDDCVHEDEHNHESPELGFQDNLYLSIDRSNVVALNTQDEAPGIIKPWHERFDETKVQ